MKSLEYINEVRYYISYGRIPGVWFTLRELFYLLFISIKNLV